MKNSFTTLIVILVVVVVNALMTACKKDQEPAPMMGTLLTYTNIPKAEFDRIDVIVDGKVAASLTQPYQVVKPVCGTESSASATAILLPAGVHSVYAIQYKNEKNVGEWNESSETIPADKCALINWVD